MTSVQDNYNKLQETFKQHIFSHTDAQALLGSWQACKELVDKGLLIDYPETNEYELLQNKSLDEMINIALIKLIYRFGLESMSPTIIEKMTTLKPEMFGNFLKKYKGNYTISLKGMVYLYSLSCNYPYFDFDNGKDLEVNSIKLDHYALGGGYRMEIIHPVTYGVETSKFGERRYSYADLRSYLYNYMVTIRDTSEKDFITMANDSINSKNIEFFNLCANLQYFKTQNQSEDTGDNVVNYHVSLSGYMPMDYSALYYSDTQELKDNALDLQTEFTFHYADEGYTIPSLEDFIEAIRTRDVITIKGQGKDLDVIIEFYD
jgi:hypothetical protein